MANVKLGTKAVGSIVKIKVNGAAKDFIIVQQGNPNTSTYDSSCAGTWLLMKDSYNYMKWEETWENNYASSDINSWLNGTFYNLIDADIRAVIKQVKIPYHGASSYGDTLHTGANGLNTKVFLLSGIEVGWTNRTDEYFPNDGAKLSYFLAGTGTNENKKRVAYRNGSAQDWYLRSPRIINTSSNNVWKVADDGSYDYDNCVNSNDIRPAFILPSTLVVSDDGTVSTNTAPAINASSTNLGKQNAPFNFAYTVTDADGDTLTVTEKLDGKTTATRTGIASGTALTFGQGSTAENFQRILNGSHTIQITANDGKDSTSLNATFTKSVTSASVTLAEPLTVEGDITVAVLQVTGSIPDDAVFKAEVTNNANDPSPVWQDATTEVQKGVNIVFENKTATAGAAFNFRVSVERGASGEGGHIEAVSGAFQ
jgi:hypothetical protein